ncbi:DUF3524 domain-containing protein [Marinobacter litoralis]|uniref:tRNA-queuosine alpha-mannosyltransferase domain-containing protein n=1 Tax=Marinobacter litoralis TaxID=187981 RepID=UPI0018EC28DE|nr:DUF3524 domain-containing protein [Marinobacter litoralis]MBJ6136577.1 DUF3524 domain-containing protein [Marinobacter litoralis]
MRDSKPRILLLSAYDAASHKRWREQLIELLPDYHWQSLTLPPRFFQWRIRGNALSWLDEPCLQEHWDLVVATSMVDLATLRGLHPRLAGTPCLFYMHENQFAFPLSQQQQNRVEPQMVNLYSAVAADRVVFNSAWNRDSFLAGAQALLNKLPDAVPDGIIERIRCKSDVIPVPIEDRLFTDGSRATNRVDRHLLWNHRREGGPILIVWAARWEYDKAPDRLLAIMRELERRETDYRVCILGERFRNAPVEFEAIRKEFHHRLEKFGYADTREEYYQWLQRADIVLSTAIHEFQGLAVLEAVAKGCIPILPDRQVYPELFGRHYVYMDCGEDIEAEAIEAANLIELQERKLQDGTARVPSVEGFRGELLKQKYEGVIERMTAFYDS